MAELVGALGEADGEALGEELGAGEALLEGEGEGGVTEILAFAVQAVKAASKATEERKRIEEFIQQLLD